MSFCECEHDGRKLTNVCALHMQFARDYAAADQPTAAEAACWHGGGFICPTCHPTLPATPDQQSVRADLEQIAEKYKSALDGLSMQDAPQPVEGAGKQSMRCTRNEAGLVQPTCEHEWAQGEIEHCAKCGYTLGHP
jgi:hypothetical protein